MNSIYFSAINLGCNKNMVDTQQLLGSVFSAPSYRPDVHLYSPDPWDEKVQLVFLNTCGFLSSGREEMFMKIDKLLKQHKCICLCGCAVQYFMKLSQDRKSEERQDRQKVLKHPSISLLSWNDMFHISLQKLVQTKYISDSFGEFDFNDSVTLYTNINKGYEYCKIAEGCNNHCSFCIIPAIRGKQRSKSIERVVKEIQHMREQGAYEVVLISQDTTRYGVDYYGKSQLWELLQEVDKLGIYYRLLYVYPDILSFSMIEKFATLRHFIPYFDIPIQHISPHVLQRMGRYYDAAHIKKLLTHIKKTFDLCFMRTNIIVGFPGEKEEDFSQLIDYLRKGTFNNISLFGYHDEPLAVSSTLDQKVDDHIIAKRVEKLSSYIIFDTIDRSHGWGFVEDIIQSKQAVVLTIRPWLHAPEIDETIQLPLSQIKNQLDGGKDINIGSRVSW